MTRSDFTAAEAAAAVDTVRALTRLCCDHGVAVMFGPVVGDNPDTCWRVNVYSTAVAGVGADALDALQSAAIEYVVSDDWQAPRRSQAFADGRRG